MDPFALTLAGSLAASLPLASLSHELGHALGARFGGQRTVLLVLGSGRPILWLRRRRPRLGLRPLPLGGLHLAEPPGPLLTRSAQLLEIAGGPVTNLALAAGLLLIGGVVASVLAAGQLLLALTQLLPLPGHDGAALVQLLRDRPAAVPALVRDAVELRGWGEEALAQRLLASAASLAAQAGELERAASLLDELGEPLDATRAFLAALARAQLASGQGASELAQRALAEARQLGAGLPGAAPLLAELDAGLGASAAEPR